MSRKYFDDTLRDDTYRWYIWFNKNDNIQAFFFCSASVIGLVFQTKHSSKMIFLTLVTEWYAFLFFGHHVFY